jgi:hypothetical protein
VVSVLTLTANASVASASTRAKANVSSDRVHTCLTVGVGVVILATASIASALPNVPADALNKTSQNLQIVANVLRHDRQIGALPTQIRSGLNEMIDASLHSVAGMAKATSDTDRQAVVARLRMELKPHEGVVQNWFLDSCAFLNSTECRGIGDSANPSASNSPSEFTEQTLKTMINSIADAIVRSCPTAVSGKQINGQSIKADPKVFATAFLAAWKAGDRTRLRKFATDATLGGIPRGDGAGDYRLLWDDNTCDIGTSRSGGCAALVTPSHGPTTKYFIDYHLTSDGTLTIDQVETEQDAAGRASSPATSIQVGTTSYKAVADLQLTILATCAPAGTM